MSDILKLNKRLGCGIIAKVSFDIDDDMFEELKKRASQIGSDFEDLIVEYIKKGLNNENGFDNMQNIQISEEILNGINSRCREINCNPEKLINSILYDYLMKVKNMPPAIDREKIGAMLEHDNPEGDDVLEKLFNLGEIGWD